LIHGFSQVKKDGSAIVGDVRVIIVRLPKKAGCQISTRQAVLQRFVLLLTASNTLQANPGCSSAAIAKRTFIARPQLRAQILIHVFLAVRELNSK